MTGFVFFIGGTWDGLSLREDDDFARPAVLHMKESPGHYSWNSASSASTVGPVSDWRAEEYRYVDSGEGWALYKLDGWSS